MTEEEFLEEVLLIYKDNFVAIALHISYLSTISSNNHKKSCSSENINISKIVRELENKKNLEEYKIYFMRIMDSFNDDIDKFDKLSKFDISGINDIFLNLRHLLEENNIRDDVKNIKNFEKDCLSINVETNRILEELGK